MYYYSVVAGPGEVNFTLSIGKSDGGVFQVGLTVLDENEVVIASLYATSLRMVAVKGIGSSRYSVERAVFVRRTVF